MRIVLPRTHLRALRHAVPLIASFAILLGTGPTAWAVCACTGMTISHTNNSNVTICSNANLNFPECARAAGSGGNGCAGSTYAYTCPVGVNSAAGLTQQTGFGVNAALTGTASECQSGHALQLSIASTLGATKPDVHATPGGNITIGTFTASVDNNTSHQFPDVGATSSALPLYGADSYTDPAANDLLIQRSANAIKWWDNTDQTKDDATETANWHYRYFSFVEGTSAATSCGCVFDITVNWPANGAATTTYTLQNGSSTNCHF